MKISVLGATGPSGQQTVLEALERGHSFVALVRNQEKLTTSNAQVLINKTVYGVPIAPLTLSRLRVLAKREKPTRMLEITRSTVEYKKFRKFLFSFGPISCF